MSNAIIDAIECEIAGTNLTYDRGHRQVQVHFAKQGGGEFLGSLIIRDEFSFPKLTPGRSVLVQLVATS